jgi:hypothetical protein
VFSNNSGDPVPSFSLPIFLVSIINTFIIEKIYYLVLIFILQGDLHTDR